MWYAISNYRERTMKNILIALLVASAVSAWAENLSAQDGKVYRNVTIVSADPERMLIVHDGGGCQVYFKDLVPDSLTAEQRTTVEEELKYHVTREKRMEQLRIEKEAFELMQREKGLIQFEGNWMTPADQQNLLAEREKQRLNLERLRVQLAKEKAALEKERLETEQARRALDADYKRDRFITTTYSYPYGSNCKTPRSHYPHGKKCTTSGTGLSGSWSGSNGSSITISSGCSSFSSGSSSSSSYNRGPFNRFGPAEYNRGPFHR